MKVLHLAPQPTRAEQLTAHSFIDEELLALRDAGIECFVLALSAECGRVRDGITRIAVPPLQTVRDRLSACRDVARAARAGAPLWLDAGTLHARRLEAVAAALATRHRIDAIHSHFGWPGGLGGSIAASLAGVPLVASVRGMDLLRIDRIGYGLTRDRRYGRNLRRMLAHASRTIYATEFMRRRGLEAGAVRERAVLVRKGVDILRFRPAAEREAARSRLGLNGPVVLAVGALQRRKGYDTLIHAMQRLADLPWTVVICGDGPERHDLQRQAAAAGLHDRVRLIGPVSRQNIPAYFAAAELFVHPAVLEAAGNVILEALASGCPVVATASGGPTEYLVEGVTGFTVPVGDATRLAARIRLLLTSPEQRDRMGQAARANAEQNYAYPLMTAALLDVYGAVSREASAESHVH